MTTQTLTATEFKAKCLDIFDRLAAHTLTRVTVTKRGKAVAVLTPPAVSEAEARQLYGFMEGTVIAPQGFDYTAPVLDEPLDAELGVIHR